MTDKMASLPEEVFISILEYAIDGFRHEVGPLPHRNNFDLVRNVAHVSKSSLQMVSNILDTYKGEFGFFVLDIMFPSDTVSFIHFLKVQGHKYRDFILSWDEFVWPGDVNINDLDIDWMQVFAQVPRLKRLDLEFIPLLSCHLPKMLLAASQCCREVEFLILPAKKDYGEWQKGPEIENVMSKLSADLKYWYEQGNCGGLRQLTVPTRSQDDVFRSSTQYIESVIQFCPNIEYLDGYNKVITHGDAYCAENWFLNLHTWETFNATCTSLREFNWAVVPFADSYFEVFAKHVKPQLRSLSLSANASWDYLQFAKYYTGPDEEIPEDDDSFGRAGYGEQATNPSVALKACPALKTLHIEIDFYHGDDWPYVNTEVYGDKFWETATIHCPLIETISLRDAPICDDYKSPSVRYQPNTICTIAKLSDRTLLLLSRLKRLSRCELGPALFTGKGIFKYICRISKLEGLIGAKRMLSVTIGGHHQWKPRFYAVILDLLKLLEGMNEIELWAAFCRTKSVLHVANLYKWKPKRAWSDNYMTNQLKPLLQLVEKEHPSLTIQVHVRGQRGNTFDCINGLTLDWSGKHRDRPLFRNVKGDTGVMHYYYAEDSMESEDESMEDDEWISIDEE